MNKKPKDIDPTNLKGQLHGYQEWYLDNKLWVRGIIKHGDRIGYYERHNWEETNFYIR